MKLIESRKKSSFQLESKVKYAADTMETDDGLQRQNKFSTSSIFLNSFFTYIFILILLFVYFIVDLVTSVAPESVFTFHKPIVATVFQYEYHTNIFALHSVAGHN